MKLKKKRQFKVQSKKRRQLSSTTTKIWKHSEMMKTASQKMKMRSNLFEKERLNVNLFQLVLQSGLNLQNQALDRLSSQEAFDLRLNCPIDRPGMRSLKNSLKDPRSREQKSAFLRERLKMNVKLEKT